MLPLYHDPWFTFSFAEDRIVPRIHLEGIEPGSQVSVIKINPETGERLGLLATATVGDGGWVDLPQAIIVKAGEGFIAVPATHQTLTILPDTFAICRLVADAAVPTWATAGTFFSITRTADELSIVCLQSLMPDGIKSERDWRCFQLAGPISFSTVGVLASLVQPLAEAGISVFAISTFDTDYLLVKAGNCSEPAKYCVRRGTRAKNHRIFRAIARSFRNSRGCSHEPSLLPRHRRFLRKLYPRTRQKR